MPVAPKLPMKFYCASCHAVYLKRYSADALFAYPACPHCSQPGQLQGTIETQDLLKHPIRVAKSYMQSALQQLQKS